MSANIKASTDGTQAIIGVGGVDQMTVSNAGVVTANSFVGAITGNVTGNVTGGGTFSGNASSATVLATGTTTARNLATRFADVVNVKDFGAVGDGVTDDTAAFQTILNIASSTNNISCFIPKGNYLINSSPIQGSTKINWIFGRDATLTGIGILPFIPAKGQLDGSPIKPEVPKVSLIDGTATVPLTNITYKTPQLYLERHTNGDNPNSSTWGNPKKTSAILSEIVAYQNETGEVNAFAGRVFSNQPKQLTSNPLVGISTLAESNSFTGQNRDVFGANFVTASQGGAGMQPQNIVGIEADVISNYGMPGIPPGNAGSINATAYWAQMAGSQNGNTAFLSTSTSVVNGWLFGIYTDAPYYDHCANLINNLNSPTARGLRVQTTWGSNTGRIFECFVGPTHESFRVDGHIGVGNSSALWVYVQGSLKNIEVGPIDSAGAGYRTLRVVN